MRTYQIKRCLLGLVLLTGSFAYSQATVAITAGDPNASEEGLNSGSFSISLSGGASLTNYTIILALDASSTATPDADYSAIPTSVDVFTGVFGNAAASVPVSVLQDNLDENDEIVVVNIVDDPNYTVVPGQETAAVTIADNDTAGVAVSPINGLVTDEGEGTDTFNISLTSQPTADVTIALSSSDAQEGTIPANSVTIQAANWDTGADVTITGVDDPQIDGDQGYIITTGDVTSTDPIYDALDGGDVADVNVTNEDNENYTVTVDDSDNNASEDGPEPGEYTINLNPTNTTGSDLTVTYTMSGSATNGADYEELDGTAVIANGQSSVEIPLNPIDDAFEENNENATLTLTDSGLYNIGGSDDATVQIADNDEAGVTIGPVSGNTNESGSTATFLVTLNSQPTAPVTIALSSSESTEGTVPSSVVIPPASWESGVTVTITGVDDNIVDGDVAYIINTGNVSSTDDNYDDLGGSDVANVNLTNLDDDSFVATVSVTDATLAEQGSNNGQFTIDLGAENGTGSPVEVEYNMGGTATNETDYSNLDGTINVPDGEQTVVITVDPNDDSAVEGTETVILNLTATADYTLGTPSSASMNLADNDSYVVSISVSDGTAAESTPANQTGAFTVSLNIPNDTGSAMEVDYTIGGTAANTADYATLSGTASIPDGGSSVNIPITPVDDAAVEGSQTVILTLQSGPDYSVGTPSSATLSIADNDNYTVSVAATDATAAESTPANQTGLYTITVSPANATGSPLTINYNMSGAATNGADYAELDGTVNISNGASTATVALTPVNDGLVENPVETAMLTIAPGAGYLIGSPNSATVNISDNDFSASVLASDATATEADSSPGEFNISLNRENNTGSPINVLYTLGGSAVNGTDYNTLSVSVSIPDGATSSTVIVTPVDDNSVEGPETVELEILGGTGYFVGTPNTATVNIADDDAAGLVIESISGNTTEAGGTATFMVSLTSQPSTSVTLNMNSSIPTEGTVPSSVSLTPANWETGVEVTVTGVDDEVVDGDRTYSIITNDVTSGDPEYDAIGGADVPNIVVINEDNDTFTATLTATDAEATEDENDNGVFTIDLGVENGTAGNVAVSFSIGGTAINGTDYATIPATVNIPNGQQTATVVIDPINDEFLESTETVVLTLLPSGAYDIGDPDSGQVDLIDDDAASLTVNNVTGAEGEDLVFTITLNNEIADGGFSVTTGYDGGTATGGLPPLESPEDYDSSPQVLNFEGEEGETVQFTVATLTDTLPEGTETFTVTLTSSNPLIDTSDTGTGTITDSDTDEDGLTDGLEADLGTDPFDPDTDGDGLDDPTEVGDPTNPNDEDSDGIIDAIDSDTEDTDGDGVNDQQDPGNEDGCVPDNMSATCDTDGDGISDGDEMTNGSDHLDPCDPNISSPTCILGDVDLSLSKILENPTPSGRYAIGEQLIFRATVTNLSPDIPAINIPIQEVIQSGFRFLGTLSDSNYDPELGLWSITRLDPGESAELRIEVEITPKTVEDGERRNSVLLDLSFTRDSNPENNAATVEDISINVFNEQEAGFLYNQFSPNGDGVNDYLVIEDIARYPEVFIRVFDRYGNEVFGMDNYDNSWDGTGENGNLPKGTYFYILYLGDGSEVRNGWIQIIR